MKNRLQKLTVTFCCLVLFVSFSSAQSNSIYFTEDWESGTLNSWTTADESPVYWHLSEWNAYDGYCWWMADPTLGNNGGYANYWYQVLDTDPISLSGENLKLTFFQRYSVEPIGGDANYDGWDGMNIRISTDQGETWQVVTTVTPDYNCTSMYSFGFTHGEGKGVPGWGGELLEWTEVTADLSGFSGQTVIIRFAFGSDPGLATGTEGGSPDLFGWQIDNIIVSNSIETLFTNNGSEEGLMPKNKYGGNLWHVAEEDGNYFASCNNESNIFLRGMKNLLISDFIELPNIEELNLDFKLRGTYQNPAGGPPEARNHFSCYVYVFDEYHELTNYNDFAPTDWDLYSTFYGREPIDLSSLRGQTIQLIFKFNSNTYDPIGSGLQIDDIIIYDPTPVSVETDDDVPTSFVLMQNYPNPFNPTTRIKYQVASIENVSLIVYDVLGREIKTLINKQLQPGEYEIEFDTGKLSSGIYFYRLSSGSFVDVKKMILMK